MKRSIFGLAGLMLMASTGFAQAADCDVALGEKMFKRCKACHKLDDGAKGIGPHLFGIAEYGVTSLVDLGLPVTMADLDLALRRQFEQVFGAP